MELGLKIAMNIPPCAKPCAVTKSLKSSCEIEL